MPPTGSFFQKIDGLNFFNGFNGFQYLHNEKRPPFVDLFFAQKIVLPIFHFRPRAPIKKLAITYGWIFNQVVHLGNAKDTLLYI